MGKSKKNLNIYVTYKNEKERRAFYNIQNTIFNQISKKKLFLKGNNKNKAFFVF